MLTEGWDANTVTHVLGVRAFGTQLLCEQVVGRALRRMSYATNEDGFFEPEYAEVFGVPFNFIPANGTTNPKPQLKSTRVRALDDRIGCAISFPRVTGYRFEVQGERLTAQFDDSSQMALSPHDVPTWTDTASVLGETNRLSLYDLSLMRMNQVLFELARHITTRYFPADDPTKTQNPEPKTWLFPQVLSVTRRWAEQYVTCKDEAIPQLLWLAEFRNLAAEKIYHAIVRGAESAVPDQPPALMPILRPYDTTGSTRYVDFDTTKSVMVTDPDKCHISHVVADTGSWEQKMAQVLEEMPEVVRYVKNQGLGFTIPYTISGDERQYTPDFIACLDDGDGPDDLLNLICEVSGDARKDKAAKVETARDLWVPAINNHGGFGRWAFVNVTDPWDAEKVIWAAFQTEVPA
jgi:type III restriction enzyme